MLNGADRNTIPTSDSDPKLDETLEGIWNLILSCAEAEVLKSLTFLS